MYRTKAVYVNTDEMGAPLTTAGSLIAKWNMVMREENTRKKKEESKKVTYLNDTKSGQKETHWPSVQNTCILWHIVFHGKIIHQNIHSENV